MTEFYRQFAQHGRVSETKRRRISTDEAAELEGGEDISDAGLGIDLSRVSKKTNLQKKKKFDFCVQNSFENSFDLFYIMMLHNF